MKTTPTPMNTLETLTGVPVPALLFLAVLTLAGCAAQKKPAIPWRTAVLVRPIIPAAPADDGESTEIPDIGADIPVPAPLNIARNAPTRPRVPTPAPPRETPSGKLDVPQIVPELSAEESSALQQETQQNLDNAERNVASASRRNLNATQTDLASKVRGFISDARDAGKAGDWSRARDLAKKAQVLAQELVNSLQGS